MAFSPRTTAPQKNDKNYINTSYGGLNNSKVIDRATGEVLPNCVGYVRGRELEISGKTHTRNQDAKYFWYNCPASLERSQTPALGAIAVWDGDYGHVAIVEGIWDGYIVVSQSNYGGTRWELVRCYLRNGKYVSAQGNTRFLGFVYLPYRQTPPSHTAIAKEVIQGKWGNGLTRKLKLEKAGYNYDVIQSLVNKLWKEGYRG